MTDPSEKGETTRARLDASRARVVLLFVAIAVSLASFSSPLWAPRFELKLEPRAITPELGLAYTTPLPQPKLPFPLDVPTDTSGNVGSNLELRENGLLLGAAHSAHEDIRSQGGGRFSHWYDYLYFSTSDGTDPRVNGRAYVATGSARLPQLLLNAVLLADAAIIFFLRRWILALLVRHRRMVAGAVVVGACSAAAMLASGAFGVVNPTGSPPKYPGLVLSIVAHVALGCVLTLAQWAMGAGVARALSSKNRNILCSDHIAGIPAQSFSARCSHGHSAGRSLRFNRRAISMGGLLIAAGSVADRTRACAKPVESPAQPAGPELCIRLLDVIALARTDRSDPRRLIR